MISHSFSENCALQQLTRANKYMHIYSGNLNLEAGRKHILYFLHAAETNFEGLNEHDGSAMVTSPEEKNPILPKYM